MLCIHQTMLYLHIVLGVVALVVFWLPIASRKGGVMHIKAGRIYVWSMYVVSASGILMAVMVLSAPWYFKAELLARANNPAVMLQQIYEFWSLLLLLSVLTFVGVRQAMLVLQHKHDSSVFRRFGYLWLPITLLACALVVLMIAIKASLAAQQTLILHYIFAGLGTVNGLQMLGFAWQRSPAPKRWLIEHISATLGSGIAVYTAFFAFGARHWLSFLGQWQLLSWILPGVIGTFAIFWATKRYTQLRTKRVQGTAQP